MKKAKEDIIMKFNPANSQEGEQSDCYAYDDDSICIQCNNKYYLKDGACFACNIDNIISCDAPNSQCKGCIKRSSGMGQNKFEKRGWLDSCEAGYYLKFWAFCEKCGNTCDINNCECCKKENSDYCWICREGFERKLINGK